MRRFAFSAFSTAFTAWTRRATRSALPVLALISVALLALTLGVTLRHRRPTPLLPPDRLTVAVLNVGQGEASWIRTPGGRFIVIGGGPPGRGAEVAASLKEAGAKQIDLLVLPYPYAEALGGAQELVQAFPTKQVVEAGGASVNQWHEQLRAKLRARNIPVRTVRAGDWFQFGQARLDILAPGEPLVTTAPAAANNSLAVRLTWDKTHFLWLGGLEQAGEITLLGRMPPLHADWLRVAHFGGPGTSSPEMLRLVSPRFAVVSVGPNRDKLPSSDVLDRLEATGARVYRTDAQPGALRFMSDGQSVTAPE